MKKTTSKRLLSLLLCGVLTAAIALTTAGCESNQSETASSGVTASQAAEAISVGEGKTEFAFTVTDPTGTQTDFLVHTDKTTVGEALEAADLIAGEEGSYGLYVKTVNGVTLDYDTDGKYWAFYIDGQYAATGVDSTKIQAGSAYAFRAE